MPSSLLQDVNNLFQTCTTNQEQAVRTQLVNRFIINFSIFDWCERFPDSYKSTSRFMLPTSQHQTDFTISN